MFGPLPQLYRVLVVVGAVLLSIGVGVWLTFAFDLSLPLGGLLLGGAVGIVLAFALVHDFSRRQQPRTVRIHRRR